MSTVFTKIVQGEIPSYKLAEDDRFYAFLDINPLSKGHALVIPKQETDYLFDLPPALLGDLFRFAQQVAGAIRRSVPCKRIGVVVLGLEVPHAHIHLVPLNSESDVDFRKPKLQLPDGEMAALAGKIREELSAKN
ncbi:MAG: HIT family protein [Prevotellaceae bacterium]|jgi:histidine triad (HIT) family protein|nr:HIT family protein [Prevotellaceae bacterium]